MIQDRPQKPLQSRRPDHRRRPVGAVIGLVTNNTDPEKMGRIKVRFPWLHDSVESHWARIAQPYGGPGRGSFWLPELGDEVCVIFDRGDPNHPYVLGGLWNGIDLVPRPGNPDGRDNTKIWQTRNGHKLVFEDHPGAERITFTDGQGERHLVIDVAEDTITITSAPGDMTWEAPQEHIKLECVTLDIDVSRNSTWKIDTALTEQCTDRIETIAGPDTLTVGQNWNVVTKNGTVQAGKSQLNFKQGGNTVTGGLAFSSNSRSLVSTTVRRRTAPETTGAQKFTVKADDTFASVVNGPTQIKHNQLDSTAKDTVIAGGPSTSILGGTVSISSGSGLSTVAKKVVIGKGGPTQPEQVAARAKDWIEFVVRDIEDKPLKGRRYRLVMPDGAVRTGELDGSGVVRADGVISGSCVLNLEDED